MKDKKYYCIPVLLLSDFERKRKLFRAKYENYWEDEIPLSPVELMAVFDECFGRTK